MLRSDLLSACTVSSSLEALRAITNAHGTYSTFRFVLRLSPRIHRLLSEMPTGIVPVPEFDKAQAMSTYLHETIHWWQHIGSTYGFILGLNYPVQTHSVFAGLKQLIALDGFKKSIFEQAELLKTRI